MADEALLGHIADMVCAHVSNNSVRANDLPGLLQADCASLAALAQASQPIEQGLAPAVPV